MSLFHNLFGEWQLKIISIAFTPLIVSYTVEILPYSIRAKGFNIFNFSVSLSLIFNQYVNPVALGKISWKYYVRPSHQAQFDLPISRNLTFSRSYTVVGSLSNSFIASCSSLKRKTVRWKRRPLYLMAKRLWSRLNTKPLHMRG